MKGMPSCSSESFHADERNSLLDLKEGLNFTSSLNTLQSWKGFNWCEWEGVTCHPITAHVISLDLSPESVNASWITDVNFRWPFMSWRELRGGLFQLRHLQRLDLSGSAFFPPLAIPSRLYKLRNLRYLSLYASNFVGQIPKEIANLSALTYLDFSNNYLNGTIPIFLGYLSKLTSLSLGGDIFSGNIPTSLGNLLKLTYLDLSSNYLNGTIPTLLNKFSKRRELNLGFNSLRGTIPTSLRLVKCLDLSDNNLTGKIPWDVESLKALIILNVSGNHFSGEIPKSLGSMVQLESLDLSRNELAGMFPVELIYLTYLSYFDVSHNNLSGVIPQGGQMMAFNASSFSNNLDLCGLQINVSCSRKQSVSSNDDEENKEMLQEDMWWDVGIGMGSTLGFLVVIWMLCFSEYWRTKCFRVMDDIIDYLFQPFRRRFYNTV